jgi:hypothetical protein
MGLLLVELCVVVDTHHFRGVFTVAPLNFFVANVAQNMAALFGKQAIHWNFSNV